MLRYAITDGSRFGADAGARRTGLLRDARRWALAGIDFVQLREKDLDGGELCALAEEFATIFREHGSRTKLLVNRRADIAVAGGADGVHLTSRLGELTPAQVREVFGGAVVVSASCHSIAEVERAREAGVDLVLFGPVFEKRVDGVLVVDGVGLGALAEACGAAGEMAVLALGGVTEENADECARAGAAGVAAIRMFG